MWEKEFTFTFMSLEKSKNIMRRPICHNTTKAVNVIMYKCHQNVLMERLDLDLNRYFRVDKKNIVELTLDADCEHVGLG